MHSKVILIFIILLAVVYQGLIFCSRKKKRRILYKMAQARSHATGLPLMIIGDPYNGIASITTGSDYGCGDVCVDITGCPNCADQGTKVLHGALEDILPTLDLSQYIVYISCVLEYVSDLPKVIQHLEQVGDGNLFIVNVEPYSFEAYFYPYYLTGEQPPKYIITRCPPLHADISFRVNPVSPAYT